MSARHVAGILSAGTMAVILLNASSANAQVNAPRVHASPVRSQLTPKNLTAMPPVAMKRTPPVNNQAAKSSLAADRADAQREAQRLQRPPLASLASTAARPHVVAQRPQVSKVGVVGGRR
jgi:hypothetical protein